MMINNFHQIYIKNFLYEINNYIIYLILIGKFYLTLIIK